MRNRNISIALGVLLLLVIVALFFYNNREKSVVRPSESSETATGESATSERDSEYYTRILESSPQEEYEPTVWTTDHVRPLPIPSRKWDDSETPQLSDLPDTLRWDYFKPERNRPFTTTEKQVLASRGFFFELIPAPSWIDYDDMIDRYVSHRVVDFGEDYSTVPLFITSDFLLHVYHVVFDRALQQAEERKLYFLVQKMTSKLYNDFVHHSELNPSPESIGAVRRNIAFFGVAASLLDSTFLVAAEAKELVGRELGLIADAQGVSVSPLTNQNRDYSQFVVRGHYTKNERLARYFKVMMWYGGTSFPVDSVALTLMALQQVQVLGKTETFPLWKRLSRLFGYLVGSATDLSPEDYDHLRARVFENSSWSLDFFTGGNLPKFMSRARAATGEKDNTRLMGARSPEQSSERGYRFFGQRFTPDAAIFTALTSPRIGSEAVSRTMPTALDVMCVFGSPVAAQMVTSNFSIPGYRSSLEGLTAEFKGYPEEVWTKSVYLSWLHTIMSLLPEKGDGYPFFARGRFWAMKSLATALASWAELKHDTMLMSKQSGAESGEGGEGPPLPPQPKSYVEPDMVFFNRFVDLLQTTSRVLSDNMILSEEYLKKFSMYFDRVVRLRSLVQKELSNAPISKEEYKLMLDFPADIQSIVIPEGTGDIIDNKYKQMALVTDVHTDLGEERVLEEAVGAPQRIYVAVKDDPGGTRVCVGYIYSYYEFTQPIGKRMTDDEWKELVYPSEAAKGPREDRVASREPGWIRELRLP
jgi:hypothetical protein